VIPAQFDSAEDFSEGLARVLVDGKYGFINRTGTVVVPPQFKNAGDFSSGVTD
jgi:hypothetical protein